MLITDKERIDLLRLARDREIFLFSMAAIATVLYAANISVAGPMLVGMTGYWLAQLLTTIRRMREIRQGTAPDLRTREDRDGR